MSLSYIIHKESYQSTSNKIDLITLASLPKPYNSYTTEEIKLKYELSLHQCRQIVVNLKSSLKKHIKERKNPEGFELLKAWFRNDALTEERLDKIANPLYEHLKRYKKSEFNPTFYEEVIDRLHKDAIKNIALTNSYGGGMGDLTLLIQNALTDLMKHKDIFGCYDRLNSGTLQFKFTYEYGRQNILETIDTIENSITGVIDWLEGNPKKTNTRSHVIH